jgi:hypothetical protein
MENIGNDILAAIRDLVDAIGIKPEHFTYLILIDVAIGAIWAVQRLYKDLTGPVRDIYQEDYFARQMEDFDNA